jgi:hypothetical protein
MYDHMKPDTNLVIGNYEPMHRGISTIGSFIAERQVRFDLGISRFIHGAAKPRKRIEPNAGLVAGTRPNEWGENGPYSNRGDRKTRTGNRAT